MKRLILPLAFVLLAGCATEINETKEYSCAPQNIHYDVALNRLVCVRAGAVSESPESLHIYCENGTYKKEGNTYSCIDSSKVLHVIKAIVLSNEAAFAHKQECQKLLPEIEKRVKDEDKETSFNGFRQNTSVEKVFYSVSMNSCLYIWTEVTSYSNSKDRFELFAISDGLTGQRLLNVMAIAGSADHEKNKQQFQDEIKVYE